MFTWRVFVCTLSYSVIGFIGHISNQYEAHQILESRSHDKIKIDFCELEWNLELDYFILKHLKRLL
jgi:hypothetical protein